ARLLTPMLASRFLKPHAEQREEGRITRRYVGWVERCLAHRKLTLSVSAIVVGLSIALAPLVPTAFSSEEDTGYIVLAVELAPGARLEETARVTELIRRRLQARAE